MAGYRVTDGLAAKEKAERFNPSSYLDIGYNHTRRAVRCGNIMSFYGLYLATCVKDGQILRLGAQDVHGWTFGGLCSCDRVAATSSPWFGGQGQDSVAG